MGELLRDARGSMAIPINDTRTTRRVASIVKCMDLCCNQEVDCGQPPNSSHRLWVAIDELPSLQKLEDLPTCLAEGRKYGAALMLGIQNIPQLLETYSHNVTKTLIDLCSTKLMFRSASQDVAKHISDALGYQETKEIQEGISYGADERDGVNLTSN